MPIVKNQIRERFVEFLGSRRFKPTLVKYFPSQLWRLVLALVTLSTVIGAPIGLYQILRVFHLRRSARLASLINAMRRSELITVSVLMANSDVYQKTGMVAPALVMGSFDPTAADDREFMYELFLKVGSLGFNDPEGPDEEIVARQMADQAYTSGRRRALPVGLTRGKVVYLFDLQVVGDFRPGGKLEGEKLPCLAEPGPTGQIAMIPWWIAEGLPDPRDQT